MKWETKIERIMMEIQMALANSVKEILAEQEFDKTYRGWEVAE